MSEEQNTAGTVEGAEQDSLAKAAAAGPPIDWDDAHQDEESSSDSSVEPDPLHSIYGEPAELDRRGE